jgi:hypothetical protein
MTVWVKGLSADIRKLDKAVSEFINKGQDNDSHTGSIVGGSSVNLSE